MASVTSWKALMEIVQKKIDSAQKNEVFEAVRDVYQDHVQSDVYNVYSPSAYVRRMENGGLIADENIVGNVNNNILEVMDVAPLNKSEGAITYNSQTYLTKIIENGLAYTGNAVYLFDQDMSGEPWATPRPFTKNTIDDLKQNKQHVEALKKGLKKRGIKTE